MLENFIRLTGLDLFAGLRGGVIRVTGAPNAGKSALCTYIANSLKGVRVPTTSKLYWRYINDSEHFQPLKEVLFPILSMCTGAKPALAMFMPGGHLLESNRIRSQQVQPPTASLVEFG